MSGNREKKVWLRPLLFWSRKSTNLFLPFLPGLFPYEDEDFTLEIRIPVGMDREEVMNACIRHALRVEDEFGFAILTRVKEM